MLAKVSSLALAVSLLITLTSSLAAPRSQLGSVSATLEFPCYNFAGHDNAGGDYCRCYNGASTPVASSTGANTGSNYNPCPYTQAPPAPTTTSTPYAKLVETTTLAGTSSATATPTQLPCYNFADPDHGVGDFCVCSNGISTPIAPATGSNTGSNYVPCPYTVAPTVQVTSISTPSLPATTMTATRTDE